MEALPAKAAGSVAVNCMMGDLKTSRRFSEPTQEEGEEQRRKTAAPVKCGTASTGDSNRPPPKALGDLRFGNDKKMCAGSTNEEKASRG